MSKSSESPRGTIRLTDSPDIIRARIRAAVTDSGRDVIASADKPALRNLLTIYSIVAGTSVTDAQERFAGKGYAEFKVVRSQLSLRPATPALKSSAAGPIIGGGEALFLFPALRLRLRLGASAILRTGALATLVASTFQAAACRALHRIALLGRLPCTCDATAINRAPRRGVDRIHGRNREKWHW
jgi:hypothetical protein